jgi:hypothetical protein
MVATLILIAVLPTQAQQFYAKTEYGFQLGAATYFGDLNTNYGLHFIRPAGGAFIRYSFNPYIALKGMINVTQIGYEDRFSKNDFQKIRNLSFRSDIIEAALVAEFNFFRFETGDKYHRFTPFLSGGIGLFYFNPYVNYQGQKYNLRLLGTEGQNTGQYNDRRYKPYSVCFPVGAGIKYWIKSGMNFSAGILNRFTLTDYIDDVSNTYVGEERFSSDPMHPTPAGYLQDPSIMVNGQKLGRAGKQRGDNATKDQYLILNFSLSIQLKTYKCPANNFDNWYSNQ